MATHRHQGQEHICTRMLKDIFGVLAVRSIQLRMLQEGTWGMNTPVHVGGEEVPVLRQERSIQLSILRLEELPALRCHRSAEKGRWRGTVSAPSPSLHRSSPEASQVYD